MSRRRARVEVVLVAILLLATSGVASAADPELQPPPLEYGNDLVGPQQSALHVITDTYIPLTAEEVVALVRKREAALASLLLDDMSTITGPNPTGTTVRCRSNGVCGRSLVVHARQQDNGIYCGPATVQEISNHAWGMNAVTNKYTQWHISQTWSFTDRDQQTYLSNERYALNQAVAKRYPWPYGEEYVDNGWHQGAEWHNYVVVDITDFGMPLVAGVAPHDLNVIHYLTSWPAISDQTGHYIAIRGWYGLWDGTQNPIVYYVDSSKGWGGSTGGFSDPSMDVYETIRKGNMRHTPGWIVW